MNGLNSGEATPENVAENKGMSFGGSLSIGSPNFQNQTARIYGGNIEELDLSLKKSDETKATKVQLWFDFSQCDVTIKNDFELLNGVENANPFHIIAQNGAVELILNYKQAAAFGQMLSQYAQICSTWPEVEKEIKVSI